MPALRQSEINDAAADGKVVLMLAVGSKGLPRKAFPHPSFEETLVLPPDLAAEAVAYWLALADRAEAEFVRGGSSVKAEGGGS